MNVHAGALNAVGATPLIRLERIVPDGAADVWLELEGGNPTGSYKDRMAVSLLIMMQPAPWFGKTPRRVVRTEARGDPPHDVRLRR